MVDERHARADCAGERTRAVALLEQSRSPADLARVAEVVADILGGPDADELRRAFADWLWVLYRRMGSFSGGARGACPSHERALWAAGEVAQQVQAW